MSESKMAGDEESGQQHGSSVSPTRDYVIIRYLMIVVILFSIIFAAYLLVTDKEDKWWLLFYVILQLIGLWAAFKEMFLLTMFYGGFCFSTVVMAVAGSRMASPIGIIWNNANLMMVILFAWALRRFVARKNSSGNS